MKKLVSYVLTLVLTLALFSGTAVQAEEKRVLTIGSVAGQGMEWYRGELFQRYLDEINCEIEFTYYDENPFAALLAGGDLPDIVIAENIITNILDNGLAANIQPYLEEYAPNMLKGTIAESLQLSAELLGDGNGGIYIIPQCVGIHNYNPGSSDQVMRGYVVRWDYYKEIGCPPIENDEDYLNVLMQMQANHPTTEDGFPTYLWCCMMQDIGYRGSFIKNENCPGINYWTLYQYHNDILDNELHDGYLDADYSGYWTDARFLNAIYRANPDLLDMDMFTMTSDEYSSKVTRGQYMGIAHGDGEMYWAMREKDPDTLADYVVIPSENATLYINITMPLGVLPSKFMFISANSENIDLAMQFFNILYDEDFNRQLYSGEKGVMWDYDEEGVPRLTQEALASKAAGDLYWEDPSIGGTGYQGRIWYLTGYNPGVMHSDGYPMSLFHTRDAAIASMNPVEVDMCEAYGAEYVLDIYSDMTDFRNDLGEAISSCMVEVPADKLRIIQACEDILSSGVANLVFCESDEEFDAAVEELQAEIRATGEEEVFAWYKEKWDVLKDQFNPIREEAVASIGLEMYPTSGE